MKYARYLALAVSVAILSAPIIAGDGEDLAKKYNCLACPTIDKKLTGPSLQDIATKYKNGAGAAENLPVKVKNGGGSVWGQIPMPPNSAVFEEDIYTFFDWVIAM